MTTSPVEVVILAAGLGTRMKSDTIKILHQAGGRPIIEYVLDLASKISPNKPVMVIGHQREAVQNQTSERARFAVQNEQLGTGHAVLQSADLIEKGNEDAHVLILSGDVPLTREETLKRLLDEHVRSGNGATFLTMKLDDPAMYGRVVRDAKGRVVSIVEAKDASEQERGINEVNAGIYVFRKEDLYKGLRALSTNNSQREYYLTDVIGNLIAGDRKVGAIVADDPIEALGVNSRSDLAAVEQELRKRRVLELMKAGVTFRNPDAVSIDSEVQIGPDSIVYPFVTLEGKTVIGKKCVIESGAHLRNVKIGDGVQIKTGTVAEGSVIGDQASVGPYAHLRPGTKLGSKVKIGNFVETKKAVFGDGAKASHLSYIGDAEVGRDVNIGAGTITCNYDGVNKHKTILEDGVFIGSDSQLVAPVRVGKGAYVGAGSTITKDVPADALALSRAPQKTIEGWAARKREANAAKKK